MTTNPATVTDLAALLHVNRRRIAKWRAEEQAPASLDLAEWRRWLHDSGRTKIVARIDAATSLLDGPALETATATEPQDAAEADINAPDMQQPLPDAGPAAWEKYWKGRRARQDALNSERQSRIDDRDLIAANEVKDLMRGMAAAMLDALGDVIWLAQRPQLDGVSDGLRKSLRAAHDKGVLTVRERLVPILRDKFTVITNPPAKPA